MTELEITQHASTFLMLVLMLSLPPLAVATVVGFVVGLLQAVTQIQDQSLPQTMKLVGILLTIGVAGPWLAGSLVHATRDIFNEFPVIAQSSSNAAGD